MSFECLLAKRLDRLARIAVFKQPQRRRFPNCLGAVVDVELAQHIITWTLERSGLLADGNNGFYYQTFDAAIKTEGDIMRVLDVLARDVGVIGVFSDWPATTTFYANCANQR